MALKNMTYDDWAEAVHASRGTSGYDEVMGPSPGGAAADLRVSRQRIWQLVKHNRLDMIILKHPAEKPSAWLVTAASIERWKRSKPGKQQDLPLATPRRKVRHK